MKKSILTALAALLAGGLAAQAQDISVRGTVVSRADDEPLIGATIMCEETHKGTATDIDGQFTLMVPEGANLTISYIGFQTKTVKAEPEMMIYMDEDSELLDEVVVIGYQTIKKADLTGAVSVMDMKEPLSQNTGNILNSMAGKLPGVNIVPDSKPGGGGSIRVRGMSTANSSNDPLYIVDGVPTSEGLNGINPSDIESLQVLKDAASASIYGSRAANGVVIITTKHGKGDRLNVSLSYSVSAQTIAKKYKLLDTAGWGKAWWTAQNNSGITPPGNDYLGSIYGYGNTPAIQQYVNGNPNYPVANTDWQDLIYRTAWTNNLTATVTNNTEKSSVLFSLNMINQDGNVEGTFYRRYSARVNSNFKFNKYVTIGENLMVSYWKDRAPGMGGDRGAGVLALEMLPALPARGLDGSWANPMTLLGIDYQNPLWLLDNDRDDNSTSWRIFGNAFLEVHPIEGLTLKSNLGIEHVQFFSRDLTRTMNENDQTYAGSSYGQGDTWTWTNTANYINTFNDVHHVMALVGTEAIQYTFKDVSASRQGFVSQDEQFMQVGAGTTLWGAGGGKSAWSVFSVFGKVDYNFDDRYLVSFTIRHDENSRFAKGKRGGTFPAFSLAWRPTAEPWFPKNDVLADFKVRYSWGQNGNATIPDLYPAYTTYNYGRPNGSYDMAGTGNGTTSGITKAYTGNPDLTWETTTQNNVGVDLSFLGGSVNLSGDFFVKKTRDMLTTPPVLNVAGESATVWRNTGSMRNIGWEISAGYTSPIYNDFSWTANVNISQYKNKLLYLNNTEGFLGGDVRLIPGQPMGVYWGYVCDGIFQNEVEIANHATQPGAAPGLLKYRDLNGDGVINDDDRCVIGNPNPEISLGLNLAFKYKGFTLDMFFAGDFGQDIYNNMKRILYLMSTNNALCNRASDLLDKAWTPTNTNTDIPALNTVDNNNQTRFSSWAVENGSYFKMKYLKLSYALPYKCVEKWAQNLDVFFQVENVFTATKYKGLDPELLPESWGQLFDSGSYPRPRSFSMGVNVTF
ncbi:MAG: TonB-dependent receptor [Muribaculaceae bacterium]|nr:TonB-dependent receptor [Muribaculaceae bacterium]